MLQRCVALKIVVANRLDRSYGHITSKFSRMAESLHFLTHGASLARYARESAAIIRYNQWVIDD